MLRKYLFAYTVGWLGLVGVEILLQRRVIVLHAGTSGSRPAADLTAAAAQDACISVCSSTPLLSRMRQSH